MIRICCVVVSAWAAVAGSARADAPFPAHRVAGNTYYVGSTELASFLITTPAGHFLINSSFEETVPMIRGAVESLGFKLTDVKYLLASHAHSDHVAGHAKMQALTGAKVLVMQGDDGVIASGGVGQYLYADSRWLPCPVDRVLRDGDQVTLGGVTLIARHTPGHTRGCTTWTWQEAVDGKRLDVVVIGSPNVNPGYKLVGNSDYPAIADHFATTFKLLKALPCDVFLGAHGNYYDMLAKHQRLKNNAASNPFIDPKGYQAYVELKETTFRQKLADEQAKSLDDTADAELRRWLGPQVWQRDAEGPILSLGEAGQFDDTHIFAPSVARDEGRFLLWYCGSRGFAHDLAKVRKPDERVFKLGLATSSDGKRFQRHMANPVFALDDPKRSILTPSVLRNADGSILREAGKMRMWFSSGTLGGGGRVQAIQETSSTDGIHWSEPSPVEIERAYAPTVIKTDVGYEMWYTVPGSYPWLMNHARSDDGKQWQVTPQPVLKVTQEWEHLLQIYPNVMKIGKVYLMWYASYLTSDRETTAIGFAASTDGVTWHKHPRNPVLRPDPARSWESHYVSSHSVMRLPDGSFRIWYASRKAPPFNNLYYALNTAHWTGPDADRDASPVKTGQ